MLRLEDLLIRVGTFELYADVEVVVGAKVAVVGPSGAGKSTLLSAIAGFLPPVSGRVIMDAVDVTRADPGHRPVATLFQDGNLFPHLTVAQNVGLGLRPTLKLSQEERTQVDAALERVGLAGLGGRRPAELSGGQQSRAALARVLLQRRDLLLLDEPFSALGPALKTEMLSLVEEVVADTGATLLMVSHDPADALQIAEHTIVVADCCVHAPEPTERLLADPPPALRAYLGG